MGKFYLRIVSRRFILLFDQKIPEKATFMCYFIKWNPISNLGFLRLQEEGMLIDSYRKNWQSVP